MSEVMTMPYYFPPEEFYETEEEVTKEPYDPTSEEVCVGTACADFKSNAIYNAEGAEILDFSEVYEPSVPTMEDDSQEKISESGGGNVLISSDQVKQLYQTMQIQPEPINIAPKTPDINWKVVGVAAFAFYLLRKR